MALFKSKEEKQINLMEKYGLTGLTHQEDIDSLQKIANELAGTGLMETGMALTMAKATDSLPIYYLRAIMEQNFIMIRQLDRISKALEK